MSGGKQRAIVSHDPYQPDYRYTLTESIGRNFADDFKPELTPAEMLKLGIFSGSYFGDADLSEYPSSWFTNAKLADTHTVELNYFHVDASQPRAEWERKGWIREQDPRGWFQWYCRYYMGRRSEDDDRQIKRWKNMTRHIGQIKAACTPGDELCRPRQRQALLHWAYDSRKI